MNKLLSTAVMILCLAPLSLPVVAQASPFDGATVLKVGGALQQDWGGKHRKGDRDNRDNGNQGNDGQRSNWNNDDDRGGRDDNRRDDRAIKARNIAQRYGRVIDVNPDGGPYFTARVATSDGRRVDLRINADTGSVSEE